MLKRLFGRAAEPSYITVVSGLPRSGTSMMMKMLEAGGIPPLQDGLRTADPDNPKGYYEFERVKQLDKGDVAWLDDARGKTVKIISALLVHLPPTHTYRVLLMQRDLDAVLASQAKMLARRGEPAAADDAALKPIFAQHLRQVEAWARNMPQVRLLHVDYAQLVQSPQDQLPAINQFLDGRLNIARMAAVADPTLHRNR